MLSAKRALRTWPGVLTFFCEVGRGQHTGGRDRRMEESEASLVYIALDWPGSHSEIRLVR